MSDVQRLLERRAQWQKARKALSWPEKIRMAETIRESAIRLRATASSKRQDGRSRQA